MTSRAQSYGRETSRSKSERSRCQAPPGEQWTRADRPRHSPTPRPELRQLQDGSIIFEADPFGMADQRVELWSQTDGIRHRRDDQGERHEKSDHQKGVYRRLRTQSRLSGKSPAGSIRPGSWYTRFLCRELAHLIACSLDAVGSRHVLQDTVLRLVQGLQNPRTPCPGAGRVPDLRCRPRSSSSTCRR